MNRCWSFMLLFVAGDPVPATSSFSSPIRTPNGLQQTYTKGVRELDNRRELLNQAVLCGLALFVPQPTHSAENAVLDDRGGRLLEITDPNTYSALAYFPPASKPQKKPLPLLIVLHGAGKNELDVWNLANPNGEHAGLVPSLLATGQAPKELAENFVVVAPYSKGKRSFYEEPRKKLLQFVDWICSTPGVAGMPQIDPQRVFLFGFSDGATVAVELLTTQRFAGGVVCAYGFTGELPQLALDRLRDIPMWVFHSADDVIFSVRNSDKLVESLKGNNSKNNIVRYTRYERDQEGFTGSVQGHSTGITASKQPEIYKWMLSI